MEMKTQVAQREKNMRTSAVVTAISLCFILAYIPSTAAAATAVVVSVDRPEGCLRIRGGPSTGAAVVGCADMGSIVRLTGAWTNNNWAEVSRPVRGWVWGPQIRTDSAPAVVERAVTDPAVAAYRRGRYPYRNYRRYRRGYRYPQARPYGVRVGPRGVAVRAPGVSVGVGRGGRVRIRRR